MKTWIGEAALQPKEPPLSLIVPKELDASYQYQSIFLSLKHRTDAHDGETREPEGQRSNRLTREVSGSISRGAHTHDVFIILRLISALRCTASRNGLLLVLVLLSVASSSWRTWKVLRRQKGREGPSQTHPGA